MTPNPTCAQPAHTVEEAAQMMKREDVGLLPVVDEGQRLVGVLTDRDIVVNAIATGCDVRETTVVDVMTSEPVCCHLGESADGAVTLMASRQIRRVPIVDEARKVVGIISQADVATRLGNDRRTGDVVEAISQPAH
jgi:CBS domain-containing protein